MHQIIFNPTAGKKKAKQALETVCKALRERNVAFQVHQTMAAHDAETIARRLTAAGASNLIVVGGDGTLHEVLNGIVDPAHCTLGVIPAGTGNDFAEAAGIPLDAAEAVKIILERKAKSVDFLQVGDRRCMNVTGLGIDVQVLERCARGKMKGKLKYLMSLIQTVFTYKGCKVHIESDGVEDARDVLLAAACNGSQFGGGIRICPTAEIGDGKINVVTVDCLGGVFKILKAFTALMKGKILSYSKTKHFLCDRVRLTTETPCAVQLDGEIYPDLILDVQVGKGLKIYY
ncbi:MAG: diacylglycerol kinase family lipid kinase [Clostridia bacterium]|nr:diacylglycerol kinase family lipid kinase [Clostridia bacterium]